MSQNRITQMLKTSRSLMEQAAMKTRDRINPMRSKLRRLALAISPVILACGLASQAQAQWTYSAWTGDADSGITSDSSYTVAVNCNGDAVTVNGVAFQASATSGANFSLGGGFGYWGPGTPNITGGSLALARSFIYDGNPRTVTLSNLAPGATYETSLFAFGFDDSGRIQTFASGSDSIVVDQDLYGNQNGIRIAYTFVADTDSKALTITPGSGGTFHMSALANRQVSAGTPQARITSFGPGATIGPVADNAAAISWTVPFGSDPAALPATFTLSSGATCTVDGIPPVSGETRNFTSPVHYIVYSSDYVSSPAAGTFTDYTVTVSVTPVSSAKDILSFGPGATISGTDIAWFVPFGSDVTTLAPAYSVSAFAAEDATYPTLTSRNFNTPKTYTITAQDGTTQIYTVTVFSGSVISACGFQLYKPGSTTVTAELVGGYVPWNPPAAPINLTVIGGYAAYSDSTTGSTVDLPGWSKIQGNVDLFGNGPGGSMALNCYASWGGDTRVETTGSLHTIATGEAITISVDVSGGPGGPMAGPLAFHLYANGSLVTPSSSVNVSGEASKTISRAYDRTALAGHIGATTKIVLGVEDANDEGNRVIFDNVTMTTYTYPPSGTLLSIY